MFGSADLASASPLADSLGVALQLTNILRDIREDLGNGRVYLPAADLTRFGCTLAPAGTADTASDNSAPGGTIAGPMHDLIRFEAARARDWYGLGMQLMPLLDRRSAACTGAMAGIYRRLLEHIAARPQDALQHRMSLPTREKLWIAVSALAGLGRPGKAAARRPSQSRAPPGTCHDNARGSRHRRRPGRNHCRDSAARRWPRRYRAGVAAAPGRCRVFLRPRVDDHRQWPARVPALLHRLPGIAGQAGYDRLSGDPGPLRCHGAVVRPGQPGCAGPRCRARCTSPGRWPATACCRCQSGPGSPGPRWPSGSPTRQRRPGPGAAGRLAGSARPGRAGPAAAVGPVRRLRAERGRR